MGLDTTHNAWHGPYSSFMAFRRKIAEKIGINLDEMEGFATTGEPKKFSEYTHDVIPLLDHSDCDGILTPEECKMIAKGLTEILPLFDDEKDIYYRDRVKEFIAGCELAYSNNEEIEFK